MKDMQDKELPSKLCSNCRASCQLGLVKVVLDLEPPCKNCEESNVLSSV
jgi:hypothetical protein